MENDIFYYVHEGHMCSGKILGTLTLDVESKSYMHREQIVGHILGNVSVKTVPDNGKYALMQGRIVVPFHQLHRTQQEAADAYRDQLLKEVD